MTVRPLRKKSKNASYFSHEFIIANHGDIVSFVAMLIIMGLLYKGTNSLSSTFVFIQHNATAEDQTQRTPLYGPGKNDLCVIFFYTLIFIVSHAVIQEYILDRFAKKLNLTKVRLAKFNESAHLTIFYVFSLFWAIYNVIKEELIPNLSSLWENYPQRMLPFWTKLFFIAQICFWLHEYPELYFQQIKKELIPSRLLTATAYLLGITLAYLGGLPKLCIILLVLHYASDIFLHAARALHLAEYSRVASIGFTVWNTVFVPVRMTCVILGFLVLHYGLSSSSILQVDVSASNFNTPSLRTSVMLFLFITQAFMVWNFITFHQRRRRDKQSQSISKGWFSSNQDGVTQKRKEKKKVKKEDEDASDVADSDQNNQRELRHRKPLKTRAQ
jgi:translocating chain-associated membrane protein 1